MQQLKFSYKANQIQQLFVEKILECLYIGTLDSYRLRLHNPKTVIEELVAVTCQVKENVLQRQEYVAEVSKETKSLLEKGAKGLIFSSIHLKYYIEDVLTSKLKDHDTLIQSSKLVLKDNLNYAEALVNEIKRQIDQYDGSDISDPNKIDIIDLNNFKALIEFSLIELANVGYAKQYLYHFLRTVFVHTGDENMSFDHRYELFKELFNKGKSSYIVVFNILSDQFQFSNLCEIDHSYIQVNKKFRATLPKNLADQVNKYLEDNKKNKLVGLSIEAYDHYGAVEISRVRISKALDLYHLGFSGIKNSIDRQAVVISIEDPSKASTVPSNYQLEGYTRGNQEVFNILLEKVRKLHANKVSKESIEKLTSGFRCLRMGSEAAELETKLLNFWIGLEFVFTSFKSDKSTIDRIKTYFPSCHSLIYVRRNLYDFHKAIERMGLSEKIDGYNEDLVYLAKHKTYTTVISNSSSILFKQRAREIQLWAEAPSNIEQKLKEHKNNLEWNISRLYRIRNEIVHNAAIKNNIHSNVSHLKYYLTFILNSMLDFLSNFPADVNNDGEITIEDYLISQEIMYGSLKKGSTIADYIRVKNPLEILH